MANSVNSVKGVLKTSNVAHSRSTSNAKASNKTGTTSKSKSVNMSKQSAASAISRAKSQIGIAEATGNNDGAKIVEYRFGQRGNIPWCSSFANWCYNPDHSGMNIFGLSDKDVKSSQKVLRAAKKYDCLYSAPKVGDAIIWTTNGDASHGHVGLVSEVRSDGSFVTIQGNSNNKVERISYSSLSSAKTRINSEGKSQTLQGFARIPKYYSSQKK